MSDIEGGSKKNNIFDLTKLAPIELDHEIQNAATTINIDEQKKLLNGYTEVPPDQWANLSFNDHIRYLRKDGAFRRGGFFQNSWVGNHGPKNGKQCIQLASRTSFKATKWSICTDDIDKIWKKNIIAQPVHNNTPNTVQQTTDQAETIQYLQQSIEQLKINQLKLSNEQKRIINLIKKLHGIKSK